MAVSGSVLPFVCSISYGLGDAGRGFEVCMYEQTLRLMPIGYSCDGLRTEFVSPMCSRQRGARYKYRATLARFLAWFSRFATAFLSSTSLSKDIAGAMASNTLS